MKKTTAFFMALSVFLIGMLVGSSLAPAKKAAMSIGDNNFFGIRFSIGGDKKHRNKKKRLSCCENKDNQTEITKENQDGLDRDHC